VIKVLRQAETVKRLETSSAMPVGGSPEAFRKLITDSVDNTRKVISAAKLTFE
jgi:tripartite-type tricarboxylate transporter receptor subunit TctC